MRNAEKKNHVKSNGAHAAILRDCAHVPRSVHSIIRSYEKRGGEGRDYLPQLRVFVKSFQFSTVNEIRISTLYTP